MINLINLLFQLHLTRPKFNVQTALKSDPLEITRLFVWGFGGAVVRASVFHL